MTNDWKRPYEVNNPRPGEKVAEMILAALDSSANVLALAIPTTEVQGPPDCLIIDGSIKGQRHRVLVDGIHGRAKASKERLLRLAGYKKSLSAEAAFICLGGDMSGESLLLCLKLGLTPVECESDGTRIQVHLGTATVVRHVSIHSWSLSFFGSPNDPDGLTFEEKSEELLFLGKPTRNWLCRESRKLMQKVKQDCTLTVVYKLDGPSAFESQGHTFAADGFEARFVCRIQNRVHSLQADLADLEYQPHLRKVLWSGDVPREKKILGRLPESLPDLAPLLGKNTPCKPDLHVYHPVMAASGPGLPDLSRKIKSVAITIQEP